MRRTIPAAGAALCLLLAGCSTTVPGTPVGDPSAVPKPETGSFATAARTIGPTTQGDGETLEGYRMTDTVPYLHEIDPALHFQGRVEAGSKASIQDTVKDQFGGVAATAVGDKAEVAVAVGASDTQQGTKYDAKKPARSVTVMVLRMPTPEVASGIVGSGLLTDEKTTSGSTTPKKVATQVPGYSQAVAYTQTYQSAGTPTVAFVAHKQYVIGVYGNFSTDQIRTYFDKQTAGLDGFTPTPVDKLASLPRDESGVAKLTLAPAKNAGGYSVPSRRAVLRQSDVARSVKTFADAGVDVVGSGGNTVYRARDAQGAQHIADEFLDETTMAYPSAQKESVKGAPGATCLTFPNYEGADSHTTYCFVVVGRYLAELPSSQRNLAMQGIGAAYLILAAAK